MGKGSGHYWLINQFIQNIRNNTDDCVPFNEAYFVQKLNYEMGESVERQLL